MLIDILLMYLTLVLEQSNMPVSCLVSFHGLWKPFDGISTNFHKHMWGIKVKEFKI